MVDEKNLFMGLVYSFLSRILKVFIDFVIGLINYVYKYKLVYYYLELEDKEIFVKLY